MLVKTLLESKPRNIITTSKATSVDAAMDLMITNNIGCLPVVDDAGKLIGILSDKDIFRKIHATKGQYHNLTVGDIMTDVLIVGLPDDEISYIAGLMNKNWIRHIPILDGEKLVGLVSQRDIIRTQAEHHEIENRYLNLYIEGLHHRDQSSADE
jgi:CBS domain-containing protein